MRLRDVSRTRIVELEEFGSTIGCGLLMRSGCGVEAGSAADRFTVAESLPGATQGKLDDAAKDIAPLFRIQRVVWRAADVLRSI